MASSRLELRIDQADKQLIERGAIAAGFSSTSEFVLVKMKEESENALKSALDSHLSNDRFNDFISACEQAAPPNDKLKKAFQTAKDMGFD